MKLLFRILFLVAALTAFGCEPEVGSDAWCENIAEKPKGDLTMNEVADFAKNCILKNYADDE
ncbi:MAG: DUF3012 domain-containing protein [Gammaproteobacteria bacterium]|nr:DUF3012 domain-containing protein [Gammaproteobacteria bacterium]MCZ6854760.1 DUF3012 domain-containing protein [Gammaproteobacteria bacterium]